jgi:hypothetical protein
MRRKKLAEVVETLVEALNKRKRQRLNKVGSSRPAGWYKALVDEWDAKPSDFKPSDLAAYLHAVPHRRRR